MKRRMFLLLIFGGFFLGIFALIPTQVHAQCGGNFPPCPPPTVDQSDGNKKKPTGTPYPSYTPTATETATPTPQPTDTATPLACIPAADPSKPTDANGAPLWPLFFGGGGLLFGGIIGALLTSLFGGKAGIIGPMMNSGTPQAPGEGELLPAVNKGGIIASSDSVGIAGSVNGDVPPSTLTSAGEGKLLPAVNKGGIIARSVNGDFPPGPPQDVNGDSPPGPPQDVNGDYPPGPPV